MEALSPAGDKHEEKGGKAEDCLHDRAERRPPEREIILTHRADDPDIALSVTQRPAVTRDHKRFVRENRRKNDNKHGYPSRDTMLENNTCDDASNHE